MQENSAEKPLFENTEEEISNPLALEIKYNKVKNKRQAQEIQNVDSEPNPKQKKCDTDGFYSEISHEKESELTTSDKKDQDVPSFHELLQDLDQESKAVINNFLPLLDNSEQYEQEGLQAVNDLMNHGQLLLQSLTDQKEMICVRLKNIAETLKVKL